MKEIINLYIGQAGVQLSSAVWELFTAEHGIPMDGICLGNMHSDDLDGHDRLFYQNSMNQIIPRCVIADLESTVIDEIRTGCYKKLFGPPNLISGFEDASSLFSRGYFTQGRFIINELMKKFNNQVEVADSIQGIVFMHALGGGTGSGLFSLLLEELDNFTKVIKIDLSVHPSFSSSQIIVEPYNSILAEHYTIDEVDISFMVDNEALFRIANDHLNVRQPSFATINRIVAQAFSVVTSSSRFSDYSCTISEILHNLVPFPRIHYPMCSLAPLSNQENLQHSINSIHSVTKEALSSKCQLLSCDPMEGKYMTCCLMYKGNVSTGDVHDAVKKIKCYENLNFVDWSPTGIKVTICSKTPLYIAKSHLGASDKLLAVVSNNSAVTDPLLHNTFRFQLLFQKRAFVHWFIGEGMEEDEFKDSLENLACLIKDYEECSLSTKLFVDPPTKQEGNGNQNELDFASVINPIPSDEVVVNDDIVKYVGNESSDINESDDKAYNNANNDAVDDSVSSLTAGQ